MLKTWIKNFWKWFIFKIVNFVDPKVAYQQNDTSEIYYHA